MVGSSNACTVRVPLKSAVCIFFTPFFTAVYIVERLIFHDSFFFHLTFIRTPFKLQHNFFVFVLYILRKVATNYIIAVYTAEQVCIRENLSEP